MNLKPPAGVSFGCNPRASWIASKTDPCGRSGVQNPNASKTFLFNVRERNFGGVVVPFGMQFGVISLLCVCVCVCVCVCGVAFHSDLERFGTAVDLCLHSLWSDLATADSVWDDFAAQF